MQLRSFISAKLHGMVITACHPDYHGSQSIPRSVLKASGIEPYERVLVVNQNNGKRWETYAIPGPEGECTLNGAAAWNGVPGDRLIIMAFRLSETYKPATVLMFGEGNHVREQFRYERDDEATPPHP